MISNVFIINPVSGVRNKSKIVKIIDKYFKDELSYEIKKMYTEYPGHAFEIAHTEQKKGTKIITAVGGDGTINEVAKALMYTDSRLAVIPVGSGNGFARHFRIPLNVHAAVKRVLNGREIEIDVGFVNDKAFFCTSGIGFDAETGMAFTQFDTRGLLAYVFSFLHVFKNYLAKKYIIVIDNETIECEAFFINIANISQYGYHFVIAPGASASDGTLDLVIIRKFPKWKGFFLAFYMVFGIINKSNYVIHRKVKNVTIRTYEKNNIIHFDGEPEIIQGNELIYTVKNKALKVNI